MPRRRDLTPEELYAPRTQVKREASYTEDSDLDREALRDRNRKLLKERGLAEWEVRLVLDWDHEPQAKPEPRVRGERECVVCGTTFVVTTATAKRTVTCSCKCAARLAVERRAGRA